MEHQNEMDTGVMSSSKSDPVDLSFDNGQDSEFMHAQEAAVEEVRRTLPEEETLFQLSELFRVFGDSTRIRILFVLLASEMCVRDIALLLDMSVSAISHQLRVLKAADLVRSRRDGKTVFYALADDHVRTMLGQGMEHVNE